ncbi:MAG TPA: acyl--CoA ligase [Candidatus Acidoferrum sp.]|nr:acyl--CoA ligase [Candidatus Acidoferrum sp.]
MAAAETLWTALSRPPDGDIAVAAPERAPLSFGALRQLIGDTVGLLNRLGIGRGGRMAIVLPNGPEMAAAFLAIGAGAATAPLNPAYREDEFDFYLGDLEPRALVLAAGAESPARAVAVRRRIPIIELEARPDEPAGSFRLRAGGGGAASAGGMAEAEDVALLLHTSGTTSRPKLVPLSQRNILASARHIGTTLALTRGDRCLNIMPLFHIHGLIGAVLSSLAAGASVFCTPGFNALKFFGWLEEAAPTWYSAVPTMHQAILARAERNREVIARRKLRFIRSSSASLPPPVMAELEQTFSCPVIESYGMTEASHQMTSNPLPPRPRKPGTVGLAAGPDVAVVDEGGRPVPAGTTGEVVIRGPNVTAGYVANPAANASAFTGGWFRTGDQGVLDGEGYLTITGRLKELINRGGEKISPREVDDLLMTHPAVAQCVTFALPHDKLGEEVAAAIVLREGRTATERELRDFVSGRLADFKVPRKVVFLAEIPKGATGKLQRIGLAAKLGLTA